MKKNLLALVLAAATLISAVAFMAPAAFAMGDLADVTVTQSFDPVDGRRMIEVEGMVDGGKKKMWLMISEKNYAKLTKCSHGRGAGPAIAYSEKSRMVNVVICD